MDINSLLIPVIFIITSFVLFFVIQKYFKHALYKDHIPFASSFSSAMGIVFGIFIGYAAISAWQGYKETSALIEKEAYSLNSIFRALVAYPPDIKSHEEALLIKYVEAVIEKEWPLMRVDKFEIATDKTISEFTETLLLYNPKNNGELVAHQEELRLISEYRQLRLHRIWASKYDIGSPINICLAICAFLLMLHFSLYSMPNRKHHITMIFFLSTSIALLFYLIYEYHTPFHGFNAIEPKAFIRILEAWKN
jgi:hypothetical protein